MNIHECTESHEVLTLLENNAGMLRDTIICDVSFRSVCSGHTILCESRERGLGSKPRQWEQNAVDAINALDVETRCVTEDARKAGMTPAPRHRPKAVLIGATLRVV